DDVVHPAGDIGTNSCAARTTNWTASGIWANFSSDTYKARPSSGPTFPAGGPGYTRDVMLQGLWASAPFLHNNQLGMQSSDPSVSGRVAAYQDAMDKLLNPSHRTNIVLRTTDWIQLPTGTILPAGTPINAFANSNGAGGTLCPNYAGTGA